MRSPRNRLHASSASSADGQQHNLFLLRRNAERAPQALMDFDSLKSFGSGLGTAAGAQPAPQTRPRRRSLYRTRNPSRNPAE